MTLPNFVIAGTARSGTTSLYYYLKQHPEIGFPAKKEPKYFSSIGLRFPHQGPGDRIVDKLMIRDFATYQSLFEGLEVFSRVGEASSDYLFFHRHTAAEMRRVLGDIPVVLCLRNPVDRAYSAYSNLVRDQREPLSFADALDAEEQRLRENWDWMWAYKAGGLYAEQVATFLETFSRVKIVLFEELARDADAVVKELFAFLGVDDSVRVDTSTRYSYSGRVKNPLIAFFSDRGNPLAFALRQFVMRLVPRSQLERIARSAMHKEDMEAATRCALEGFFRSDIESLESMLERNLEAWRCIS